MQLEELHLAAFGRFKDRVLPLGPKLNVIYGPNEAGKSTIYRFVQGMLYGAAKPGLKVRRMMEEYEALRPWGATDYHGTIVLTLDDGRQLRVERDFNRHQVRVYENVTGQLLSFPQDLRQEPLFAQQFLGLSQSEFTATVSIGQLAVRDIDDSVAHNLSTRLAALKSSGRDDETAARAVATLEKWMDRIGTPRARLTTPLGTAMGKRADLEEAIARVVRARGDNMGREAELAGLQFEHESLNRERQRLGDAVATAESQALLAGVQQVEKHIAAAQEHEAKADALMAELKPLQLLAAVAPGHAAQLRADFRSHQEATQREGRAKEQHERQAAEVRRLEEQISRLGISADPVMVEAEVDGLQAEVDRLRAVAATAPRSAGPGRWWVALAVIGAVAAVLGLLVSTWLWVLLLGAVPFIFLAVRPEAPPSRAPWQQDQDAASQRLAKLLQRHGCTTSAELKGRLRSLAMLQAQRSTLAAMGGGEQSVGTERTPESIMRGMLDVVRPVADCSPALTAAIGSGALEQRHIEEFCGLYEVYHQKHKDVQNARAAGSVAWTLAESVADSLANGGRSWASPVGQACKHRDVAAVQQACDLARRHLETAATGDASPTPLPDLHLRLASVTRSIDAISQQVAELTGSIREAHKQLPDLVGLQLELEEIEARIAPLEAQRRACEYARQLIESIAEEMHRDFAPRLAAQVAPIMAHITGGRYRDVRIGDRLELSTEVPETGVLHGVHHLSLGTHDQFYFALRVGAALELTADGERPPLLCDDLLLQYDDGRAEACLRYLHGLAEGYQVLLLTCHGRERDIAYTLGANVIEL